jgi:hypothetical protein
LTVRAAARRSIRQRFSAGTMGKGGPIKMFSIPPVNHPAREAMGDMAHLAELLDPANIGKLPMMAQALSQGRRAIAEAKGAVKSVNYICLRADTAERWLISIGPRGGWRKLWNFGDGRRQR